ncbi:DNA (cytosine-5-)-methyltransferase, partial [Acinetobacter sp. YH16032]
ILRVKKPKAFLLENVKRLTTHDKGNTFETIKNKLEDLGYNLHYKVLNSLEYGGVPQKRERIYIVGFLDKVNFHFPEKLNVYRPLSEILEADEDIESKYFLSEEIRNKRFEKLKKEPPMPSIWHENIGGNISALPYSCALRAGGSYNYLVVNGTRRLTGREMLRLQGFPDTYKIDVPYTQARKVAGNSVTVTVIERIAENMINCLNSLN